MDKKKVLLTGATGNMGIEGLKQLLSEKDKYDIVVLALPTPKDKKILSKYLKDDCVSVVWGDLTDYKAVKQAVESVDIVLHVGGMVSPAADYHPGLTMKVNVGAVRNIIKAIKSLRNPDEVKLVYIGSVAQTGDRNPPLHWGRTGDPIKISIDDIYAVSKTLAEREVIESGLKYWVSLRQTAVLYPDIVKKLDPIIFHQPLNGVFEWVTAKDSGRLLTNICRDDIPEDFWCKVYNIGGGVNFRTTVSEFLEMSFSALGIGDFRKVTDHNWFATRNFHGQWFEDSDDLENILHFRSGTIKDFFENLSRNIPAFYRLAGMVSPGILRNLVFKPIAKKKSGTLNSLINNDLNRIAAFFGSKEKWQDIPSWHLVKPEYPSKEIKRLNHGYDETKSQSELDIQDMKQAAVFRGGKCLSKTMGKGDLKSKLDWQCAFNHKFEASPTLILLGGHWCPECLPAPWNYDEEAKHNPFFAQVWNHY